MTNNNTYNCKDLIEKFLSSSNKTLSLKFKHIGHINLYEGIGLYDNIQCNFNKNDLKYLSDNNEKYNIKKYYLSLLKDVNVEYVVPSMHIYTSK